MDMTLDYHWWYSDAIQFNASNNNDHWIVGVLQEVGTVSLWTTVDSLFESNASVKGPLKVHACGLAFRQLIRSTYTNL